MYSGHKPQKRKSGKSCLMIFVAIVGIIAIVTFCALLHGKNNTVVSPLAEQNEPQSLFDVFMPKKDPDELRDLIKKAGWVNVEQLFRLCV